MGGRGEDERLIMIIAAALYAAFGLVVVSALVLTIPQQAASGKLSKNIAVGIRTRETKKSEEAWQAGHLAAIPILKATGIIGLIMAGVLIISGLFGEKMSAVTVTSAILGYVVTIGGVLVARFRAHSVAKNTNNDLAALAHTA